MDAGMAALRSQLDEAAHNLSLSHRPHPPQPAAGHISYQQHPYANPGPPQLSGPPSHARMSVPPGPQGQGQSGGFAAQLGNVMLTSEDKQEGYDSSLAYLAPRGSPPSPMAPLPPVPRSATPISPSVPRYQLSDGPAAPPVQQFHQSHPPVPPVSMAGIQPGMILSHPVSHSLPHSGYPAPMPLPLPASQGSDVGLSRKPSLTVSAQAAQAHPNEANGSPDPVPYRTHDSPMPFRSFNNLGSGGNSSPGSPPAMGSHPGAHDHKALPPPPMPLSSGSDDSHEAIDMPVNPSSEKIWTDEVAAYRDIEDEEAERKKKKVKKGILIGLVVLVIIAVVAIAVGVTVSKKNDDGGDKADKARLEASASSASSIARFGTSEVVFTSVQTLTGNGEDGEVSTTVAAPTTSSTTSETTTTRARAIASSSSSTITDTTDTTDLSTSSAASLTTTPIRSSTSTTTSISSASETSTTPRSGQVVTRPLDDDADSSATTSAALETPTIRPGRGNSADEDGEEEEGFNLFDPLTWGSSRRALLGRSVAEHRRYRH
ncbi:hypothetical protein JCM11251_006653 [Rhodosporidiobolus azoricus]